MWSHAVPQGAASKAAVGPTRDTCPAGAGVRIGTLQVASPAPSGPEHRTTHPSPDLPQHPCGEHSRPAPRALGLRGPCLGGRCPVLVAQVPALLGCGARAPPRCPPGKEITHLLLPPLKSSSLCRMKTRG